MASVLSLRGEGICDVGGVASEMLSKVEREGICVGSVASVMLSKVERVGICDVGVWLLLFCLRNSLRGGLCDVGV